MTVHGVSAVSLSWQRVVCQLRLYTSFTLVDIYFIAACCCHRSCCYICLTSRIYAHKDGDYAKRVQSQPIKRSLIGRMLLRTASSQIFAASVAV